jgi:imidazolonepropionase-like amidohydrolase
MKHGVEIIKIFPSGGHATELPHTGVSLTDDELFAICDAAHRRGARVRAHCPAKEGILACLRAGVDIIDHGDEIDEECIERMLEQGTSFVPSMYFIHRMLEDTGNLAGATSAQMAPVREAFEGIRKMLPLANAEGLRIVIGDDYGVNILSHGRYAEELAFYVDVVGIPALDVIRWATRNGAELMGRGHELGGVAPGMLADLLVVDGDPATEITVLQDPSRIRAILTGGIFHKDLL